jgi:hypothetical protein
MVGQQGAELGKGQTLGHRRCRSQQDAIGPVDDLKGGAGLPIMGIANPLGDDDMTLGGELGSGGHESRIGQAKAASQSEALARLAAGSAGGRGFAAHFLPYAAMNLGLDGFAAGP